MHSILATTDCVSPLRSAIPVALGVLLLASAPASAVPIYSLVDIGTFGGSSSVPLALNDARQVVGYAEDSSSIRHAFVYDHASGTLTNIGASGTRSVATDINNAGQVIGRDGLLPDINVFVYDYASGTRTNLGTLVRDFQGINDAGKVVGVSSNVDTAIYDIGTDTLTNMGLSLGIPGALGSEGYDINMAGQIAGIIHFSGLTHAFFYDPSGGVVDLHTPGDIRSAAYAINSSGQVVGEAREASGRTSAFLYNSDGTKLDLGSLGGESSIPYDINDAGQIVGLSTLAGNARRAFLYDGGTMYDLNDLIDPDDLLAGTIRFYEAYGINNNGDIAARGCYISGELRGQCHAFLLIALDTDIVSSVPEPGSLALLGGALLGVPLLRRVRPRRR